MKKISFAWLCLWFIPALFLSLFLAGKKMEYNLPLNLAFNSLGVYDAFGRNLLPLTLHASFFSASFAVSVVSVSCFLSILIGTALALMSPSFRFPILRFLDMTLAFPSLLLALAWAAVQGPGWGTLIFTLALGTLPGMIRLIYVRTVELMSEGSVLSSIALGGNSAWIVTRHLLSPLLSLCKIKFPNLFAHALLAEATLSFLGVGCPIGSDTWGSLLAQGKDYLIEAPHITLITGLPLVLTLLSLQFVSGKNENF